MTGARTALEIAHRDAARAAGALALMIAKERVVRDDLRIAAARLRAAANTIDNLLKSGGKVDSRDQPC